MITKIKWNNHKILGNLELNLTNSAGKPYKTIVFAGENGTGKTTILKTLSTFLNYGSFIPFNYIQYLYNSELIELRRTSTHNEVVSDHDANYGHVYKFYVASKTQTRTYSNKENSDPDDLRKNGCVYTKARSGFNTNPIESVRTSKLDSVKYDVDSNDDFTPIKQLLVDIDSQDALEWTALSRNHSDKSYEEFDNDSRSSRFRKAFNDFFDNIQYDGIDNNGQRGMRIVFKKGNAKISIDDLSTGEQQIVFRGATLLKNIQNIDGGFVFIDEPELSMHPRWQRRILDYYKNLFKKTDGSQMVQMFIATHSEAIVESALKDNETLVVVLKDNNGVLEGTSITTPNVLPVPIASEINYLAFNVPSVDYHIALFGYLQSSNSLSTIKSVDNFIKTQSDYDEILHHKPSSFIDGRGHTHSFETLPVYVRNSIDHPDSGNTYSEEELIKSIELLRKLCS